MAGSALPAFRATMVWPEAQLKYPFAVAVDSADNLFITDWGNHRVRKVSPDGLITTVAGGGTNEPSVNGEPATALALGSLAGIAVMGRQPLCRRKPLIWIDPQEPDLEECTERRRPV